VIHLRSPRIIALHETKAAEIGEFAGWRTVIIYSSTRREHGAVRNTVGIFDVSHMKRTVIQGRGAGEYLSRLLTIDPSRLKIGRMKYCLILNEEGGIIDDLTIMRMEEEKFLLTSNAATSQRVERWLERNNPGGIDILDITDSSVLLAVQGPSAESIVSRLLGVHVGGMKWFSTLRGSYRGSELILSRSGYTGEDGFEVFMPLSGDDEPARRLWEEAVGMGAEPCGLATRDILRLECGYPLSQVDFDESLTPVEARLDWAVDKEHEFIGKSGYLSISSSGPRRLLVGILMSEGGVPRRGMQVLYSSSKVGAVTSGVLSYTLGKGIALAHVEPRVASEGTEVSIEVRGSYRRGSIRLGPFIDLRIKR